MGKAATVGAVSGAISMGIGAVASSAFTNGLTFGKAAFEAGMHGVSGGLISQASGGDFGSGFFSGLISSSIASGVNALGIDFAASSGNNTVYNSFGKDYMQAAMIAAGGLSGGISSTIAGGNFWDGLRQGIITSALNHVAHLVGDPKPKPKQQSDNKTNDTSFDYEKYKKIMDGISKGSMTLTDFYFNKHYLKELPEWFVGKYGRAISMPGSKPYTSLLSIQLRRLGWSHGGRVIGNGLAVYNFASLMVENTTYYNTVIHNNQNFEQVQQHYNDVSINPMFWLYKKIEPWLINLGK